MSVLLRGGSAFVHIPRTGGHTVRELLKRGGLIDREVGPQHGRVEDLVGYSDRVWSVVRHPLHWLRSWWGYFGPKHKRPHSDLWPFWELYRPTFTGFLGEYLASRHRGWITQYFNGVLESPRLSAGYLARTEDLGAGVLGALRWAGETPRRHLPEGLRKGVGTGPMGPVPEDMVRDFEQAEAGYYATYGYSTGVTHL